jgi:hypothetical protein
MTTTTLGAARADYYKVNNFGDDGGDSLDRVPLKVLGITFKIPNTAARKHAVKFHDLHHVVTGYQTDLAGEAEIGAWELATGCLRMPAAFVLNLFALAIGIVIAPRRMVRAWARGKATRNLYAEPAIDRLLGRTVEAVRTDLGLGAPAPRARLRDVVSTFAFGLPALAVMASPLIGVAILVRALI